MGQYSRVNGQRFFGISIPNKQTMANAALKIALNVTIVMQLTLIPIQGAAPVQTIGICVKLFLRDPVL